MNAGEETYWQPSPGAEWVKVRVLVPLGNKLRDVATVLLRLDDNTRIIVYRNGFVEEGLPG